MPQVNEGTRSASVSVTTTSSQVSPRRDDTNDMRKIFVLRNNSPNVADIITLSLGFDAAVAGSGIVLSQGQSYGEADSEGFMCHKGPINAVCATANGVLAIMER